MRVIAPGVTAAAAAGMILALTPAAHAQVRPPGGEAAPPSPSPDTESIIAVLRGYVPKHQVPAEITVREGDTLASISGKACGTPDDWTGMYERNKKVIGDNYNLILPGQVLAESCRDVPVARPRIAVATADVTTQYSPRHERAHGSYHSYYHSGGNLSFAGLESLWVSAGGDSWAASAAASVAECESGGRQYAHNPSGASGYWQILGEVVSGDVYNATVNAENAVAKWRASGKTFAQWVCQP